MIRIIIPVILFSGLVLVSLGILTLLFPVGRHSKGKEGVCNAGGSGRLNSEKGPTGKQTVKELIGQGQGVTNIDIAQTDLRGFERVARKYGIDYAIRKDPSVDPPKYLVFFKAKDADGMTAAFKEYSAAVLKKADRPSVLAELRKINALVVSLPGKAKNREKQREQSL